MLPPENVKRIAAALDRIVAEAEAFLAKVDADRNFRTFYEPIQPIAAD